MLKTKHIFETSYSDGRYICEFMHAFSIAYTHEYLENRIRYTARMYQKEFGAFIDYILELGKFGVYPILL